MLMGIVEWIMLGIVIGFLASKVVSLRGDDPRMGILAGAATAFIGGWLYCLISGATVTSLNAKSLLFAAIGAVVGLVIFHSWRWKVA